MLGCTHIQEIGFSPFTLEPRPKGAKATTVFLFFLYFESPSPPNVWHKYQDGMNNVGLFTYPRNSSLSLPHALLSLKLRKDNSCMSVFAIQHKKMQKNTIE